MDLYEKKKHVISSDEYSEDDDNDALMNDAIRAQNSSNAQLNESVLEEQPKRCLEQKQLSSLIRRHKISITYKNKSVKWLNSKRQRERYKSHITRNYQACNKAADAKKELRLKIKKRECTHDVNKVVSLDDDDNNANHEVNLNHDYNNVCGVTQTKEKENITSPEQTNVRIEYTSTTNYENHSRKRTSQSSQNHTQEKRARSCSPCAYKNRKEHGHIEKRFKAESKQLYKKINEMYPKVDYIAQNHTDYISTNTASVTEDKMKSIFNEIKSLNDILHDKEVEWNRILHLKMIKEEIYSRLSRKKYALELSENFTKMHSQNTLSDLKELESYLTENNAVSSACSSIQQIIEKRANMKTEDLERERNSTSRLHSLLMSGNMLQAINLAENNFPGNGEINVSICKDSLLKGNLESYRNHEKKTVFSKGRQLEFKDVKSIIADFRQKNRDILSPDEIYVSNDKAELHPLQGPIEEKGVKQSATLKKKSLGQEFAFANSMNSNYNACVDNNYKGNVRNNFKVNTPKTIQYPYCQECKIHESRFVCAGCGNQWYCSKKCQISAWDKHSDLCTD